MMTLDFGDELTYEDALSDNIEVAIKIKAREKVNSKKMSTKDYFSFCDNFPATTPNHPLLTNYDWVYENVEVILENFTFSYQKYQGPDEYYMFFRAMTDKYNLEEDYNRVLYMNNDDKQNYIIEQRFISKWRGFAYNFINFFANAFDLRGILDSLFEKKDFVDYFFRYPLLYTPEQLEEFGYAGMGKLSYYDNYASYYINNPDKLIIKLRRLPKLKVDERIFSNPRFIRQIAHDSNVCKFYYNMMFVLENCTGLEYLEEHKKYCDKEISGISDGIIPSLMSDYNKAEDILNKDSCKYSFYSNDNWLRVQVIERIFERLNVEELPKRDFYRELSKYMIVGMLMSRLFLTDPYDLYIDIETLYEYAIKNGKKLDGMELYEFLVNFETYSVDYIIDFYNLVKDSNMMGILYDDINREKEEFISSINDSLFDYSKLEVKVDDKGIEYYDLTDVTEKVLVSNTSVPITRADLLEKLVNDVRNGHIYRVCMSLQDKKHRYFYSEGDHKRTNSTVKFVYGKLDPRKVGIYYHRDAYSHFLNDTEIENNTYKRRFYTLNEFMDMTFNFNEIVYLVNGEPLIPIGVLAEEKISFEEASIAKELGIPIFYYKEKDLSTKPPIQEYYIKKYNREPRFKTLFPKGSKQ